MVHPAFEMALDFLADIDLSKFKPGKTELIGESVFVNAMEKETSREENALWESHESYMDIHFMLNGIETIYYAEEQHMKVDKPYDEANDCTLYTGGMGMEVPVPENGFVVFFPGEIHKAMVARDKPAIAQKLVVKIKMD